MAAIWGPQQRKSKQKTIKANQFLKTKVLLQAGTKNTGLNKRQVGVPSSSQLPPHLPAPLQHGPGTRGWGEAVSPRGDPLWLPLLSCLSPTSLWSKEGQDAGTSCHFLRTAAHLKGQGEGQKHNFPSILTRNYSSQKRMDIL